MYNYKEKTFLLILKYKIKYNKFSCNKIYLKILKKKQFIHFRTGKDLKTRRTSNSKKMILRNRIILITNLRIMILNIIFLNIHQIMNKKNKSIKKKLIRFKIKKINKNTTMNKKKYKKTKMIFKIKIIYKFTKKNISIIFNFMSS